MSLLPLIGFQQHTLDEKGRIPIGSKFLDAFKQRCEPPVEGEGVKVVTAVSLSGHVAIYPPVVYQRLVDTLGEAAMKQRELVKFRRALIMSYDEQKLDGANRLTLSKPLLEQAGVADPRADSGASGKEKQAEKKAKDTRQIMVVGADSYLEVMSVTAWSTSAFGAVRLGQAELLSAVSENDALRAFISGGGLSDASSRDAAGGA